MMGDFATVLNCMDGRVQRKVNDYLKTTFGARYIDTVTAPGMVKNIASPTDRTEEIFSDSRISTEKHGSTQIAIAAHADCAGNPVPDATQKQQLSEAMTRLHEAFPEAEIVALWLDSNQIVERIRA